MTNKEPENVTNTTILTNRVLDCLYHYASFLSGILLVLGFFAGLLVNAFTPYTEVPYKNIEASMREKELGEIPKARLDCEVSQGTKKVTRLAPELTESGQPILRELQRTAKGKGKAYHVGEEIREVLIPYLGEPQFHEFKRRPLQRGSRYRVDGRVLSVERDRIRVLLERPDGGLTEQQPSLPRPDKVILLLYEPNVLMRRTGTFERLEKIEFHATIDPQLWAVYGAVLGTVIGLAVFWKKSYQSDRK
jgi:hypothetical protein